MPRSLAFLPLFALGTLLPAQSYTVSPAAYEIAPGNGGNTIPFWSATHRYQQIHGDLTTARVITALALRRSAGSGGPARTLDLEVLMCASSFASSSTTFAANYIGTPTTVRARGSLNLPDWSTSQGSPEPWTLIVPFTTPFPHTAQNDLLWEWVIHATTSTSTYATDAFSGHSANTRVNAAITNLGTGCVATGKVSPMTQTMQLYTLTSPQTLNFSLTTTNAPNSATSSILIGPVNPNLTVPGLCEKLFSIGLWTLPATSSASGTISQPVVSAPFSAAWVGLKLFVQTASIDAGQPGLPFALSRGQQGVIPPLFPGPVPIQRIWSNSSTATTGSKETYPYGLITRFTH
jgi:hypothetical protein